MHGDPSASPYQHQHRVAWFSSAIKHQPNCIKLDALFDLMQPELIRLETGVLTKEGQCVKCYELNSLFKVKRK